MLDSKILMFSETQLSTWSNQGATVTSASTYESVRAALENPNVALGSKSKEIYLQGSYRNATNIYGDSDVDVVCQLNRTFYRDISAMPTEQQQAYLAAYSRGEYSEDQFNADVEEALSDYFGATNVRRSVKVFLVDREDGRLTADVLPALQFRKYNWFVSRGNESYTEGVKFKDREGNWTTNYPKLHIANGQAKNSRDRTNGSYKPTVRMFKNVRNYLIRTGDIAEGQSRKLRGIPTFPQLRRLLAKLSKPDISLATKSGHFNLLRTSRSLVPKAGR